MNTSRGLFRKLATVALAGFCLGSPPCRAADETGAPKGAAVTVLKAVKQCFSAIVEVSGILLPKDETAVRPDRPGLKVSDVLVDAGESVTAGQALARLNLPEGGSIAGQAPVAGLGSSPNPVDGAGAPGKGRAPFSSHPRTRV